METDLAKQDLDMQNLNKPLVAIWMVTYNHENFIEQAVESVMMQKSNFDYKLFIGEDCSTDDTINICRLLNEKYPDKIELFLNETNLGGIVNATQIYNACFYSGAKYMALLEGDDYWSDPLKLQKQVDFLENNSDYNICFHNVQIYKHKDKIFTDDTITRQVSETTDIRELANGNFIHTPSVMLRNNFTLPNWFLQAPIGDWSLYMIAIKDKKIKKLDELMAVYRVNEVGVWSGVTRLDRMLMTIKTFKLVNKNLKMNMIAKKKLSKKISDLKNVIRINRGGIYRLRYLFDIFVKKAYRISLSILRDK